MEQIRKKNRINYQNPAKRIAGYMKKYGWTEEQARHWINIGVE